MRTVAGKIAATESTLMKTFYLSLPAIALLAACGGGSTGVGNAPQFTTLDGAVDELGFFIDKAERLDPTPVANLPTSGSAEYEGVFSLGRIFERFPNDPNPQLDNPLVGEVDLDVNFAQNTVTGDADNFFGENGAVSGQLAITAGQIDRSGPDLFWDAEVNGNLPINGAQRTVEGDVFGGFSGNRSQFIGGLFLGEASDGSPLIGSILADD